MVSQPWGTTDITPGVEVTLKVAELSGWSVQTEEGIFGPDELEALLVFSQLSEDE
ncbi:MAG: hypothetical protein KDB61_01440 [Planctomycetes bacterium]|nr:hypothetical protein [Planctomycetota bacterium]